MQYRSAVDQAANVTVVRNGGGVENDGVQSIFLGYPLPAVAGSFGVDWSVALRLLQAQL
jgi:hypothetical protein